MKSFTYTNASGVFTIEQDPAILLWHISVIPHKPKAAVLFTATDLRELRWLLADAETAAGNVR